DVAVHFNARLASVKKSGARIVEFATEDGTVFRAKMFIDATYEGDLMAKAGVSYTLMREGNAKYGERFNGIYYDAKYQPRTTHLKPGPAGRVPGGQGVWDRDFPLDPYIVPGDPESGLLPFVQESEPGTPGEPAPDRKSVVYGRRDGRRGPARRQQEDKSRWWRGTDEHAARTSRPLRA